MDVHRQLAPFADGEIRLPLRTVAPQVPSAVPDLRATAFFGLYPPGHHVVVSRRRGSFPIEKIVAVLGWLGHIHLEGHVRVGSFFHGFKTAFHPPFCLGRVSGNPADCQLC